MESSLLALSGGFAAILTDAAGGSHHAVTVTGPRDAPVRATFGRVL
jgi:hypothetical protein